MADAPQNQIAIPAGHVTVTTYGPIRHETAKCLMDMRSYSEANGLKNVAWDMVNSTLVEKARNEAVRATLRNPNAGWLLFVDGDMTFPPDALLQLLQTAYGAMPFADAVGGYCTLRGDLALPTIDTGTGTWESHFPGSGVLEVMRTGAAFILVKRRVFEGMRDPWYRLRVPMRPMDAMAEIDNFARIKFDGVNPFQKQRDAAWERLEQCALEDPSVAHDTFTPAEVGEDSGFCDRARLAGFRLFVNTDVVTGHIDSKITDWMQHKRAMDEMERQQRLLCGVLE